MLPRHALSLPMRSKMLVMREAVSFLVWEAVVCVPVPVPDDHFSRVSSVVVVYRRPRWLVLRKNSMRAT